MEIAYDSAKEKRTRSIHVNISLPNHAGLTTTTLAKFWSKERCEALAGITPARQQLCAAALNKRKHGGRRHSFIIVAVVVVAAAGRSRMAGS